MKVSPMVAVAFGFLLACDGGDDAGPVSPAAAEEGCRAGCQHVIACGSPQLLEPCVAECSSEVADILRADFFADFVSCTLDLACGADDDACYACTPTAAHEAYEARCREVLELCLTPSEIDKYCGTYPNDRTTDAGNFCPLATTVIAELRACLPGGSICAISGDCIRDVLRSHGMY